MDSPSTIADILRSDKGKTPTPDALMVALHAQHKELEDKNKALKENNATIQNQAALIAVLEEKLRLKDHKLFGASSEKNALQLDWLADEAELLADGQADPDEQSDDADEEGEQAKPKKRRKPRKRFSDELPRIQKFVHLSDEQRKDAVETFFVKVKEELDIVPARVQVIEIMQERAVYLDEQGERSVRSAPRAEHPAGKGIGSIGLLAWVIISKYADALPLYRLEKILARYGGDITRTTLANWIIRVSLALEPLLDRIDAHAMRCDYIQIDETRLKVLKELGMEATGDKWIWVIRGGPPGKQVVLFNYDKSRGGAVAQRLLEDFSGRFVQSDGYSGYDKACALKNVTHLGCMDHARRKVVEAIKAQKSEEKGKASVAMVLLSHIDALYRFERQWGELSDDDRFKKRQEIAIPKLVKLKLWLDEKQPKVAPDTLTRKAINYMINQWDHLVRYCEHGQLRISNVLVENAIRPFAVGRRSWLFSDSPDGARASASMFSLIETAKANKVEPYAYVKWVLENICAAKTDEALDALLPWNVK